MPETPELKFLVLNKNQSLELVIRQHITLGRDVTSDLVLQDEEVSRSHAIIYREETGEHAGKLAIKDLNSLNGIFLNGEKIRESILKPGDEIILGGTLLLFAPNPESDLDEILSSKGRLILRRIGSPKPFKSASVEPLSVRALVDLALNELNHGSGGNGFWARFDAGLLLLRISKLLDVTEEQRFFQILLETAQQISGADRGVVMLSNPGEKSLTIRALVSDQEDKTIVISQSIIRIVMKGHKAVYSADLSADDRFADVARKQPSQRPGSLLAIPLESGEKTIGFVYLDSFNPETRFDQDCLMALALFLRPVMRFAPVPAHV